MAQVESPFSNDARLKNEINKWGNWLSSSQNAAQYTFQNTALTGGMQNVSLGAGNGDSSSPESSRSGSHYKLPELPRVANLLDLIEGVHKPNGTKVSVGSTPEFVDENEV